MSNNNSSVQYAELPTPRARNTAGAVLAIMLIAGILSIAWGWFENKIKLPPSQRTSALVLEGGATRYIADQLPHTPLPEAFAALERAGSWLLFGSLGDRVRQGCTGWLFLVDELSVHSQSQHNSDLRLSALVSVHEMLQQRGIQLIVLTVPDKSRIQKEALCHVYRPAASEDRLSNWVTGLREHQVNVVDLTQKLALAAQTDGQPFLRTDTHWSEEGARIAAQAIAQTVSRIGIQLTPPRNTLLKSGAPEEREGDLIRLAGIDWLPPYLKPAPDRFRPTIFSENDMANSSDSELDHSDALLGDTGLPSVVLLGTSYSNASGFLSFLENSLETIVPSLAQDGGDFWGAASDFLNGPTLESSPPKLLIWEVPERVIQQPLAPSEQAWINTLLQAPKSH